MAWLAWLPIGAGGRRLQHVPPCLTIPTCLLRYCLWRRALLSVLPPLLRGLLLLFHSAPCAPAAPRCCLYRSPPDAASDGGSATLRS